jgi:hypothetical protein
MNIRQKIDKNKYIVTFLITALIFGSMLYVNNILDQKRTADVKLIQDQIALDLLSSETQFNLLKEASCKNISDSALSKELNSLATKLSYLESNQNNKNDDELIYLKKYYSLLQIKDWILMRQLSEKCSGQRPISVLYFYGNKSDCPECENMSFVLTKLRQQYPELRIYSFDTNLKLGALETLTSTYKISPNALPAVVYQDDVHIGFRSINEIKEIIPRLKEVDIEREKEEMEKVNAMKTEELSKENE